MLAGGDEEAASVIVATIISMRTTPAWKAILAGHSCLHKYFLRTVYGEVIIKGVQYIDIRYIENHFGEIIRNESEIESGLAAADCTVESLKADNKRIIDGFHSAGEYVVLIDSDYEQTIKGLLD